MRLSRLLSKHSTDATFRNQIGSIILIYVQRFGRYEFSNGPLQFEILVKKTPQIKNDGRSRLVELTNLYIVGCLLENWGARGKATLDVKST
jgi:hypothetical protein